MAKFIQAQFRFDLGGYVARTRKQIAAVEALPERALQYFISQTPVRSGNARRNTELKNNKTIVGDYAYGQRLDEGWSKQSPRGMSKPTQEWLEREFKRIFRR